MKIVTLGPKGTYSEEAALLYQEQATGQTKPDEIGFFNIHQCLLEVESFRADRAVLPAENMVDGIIGLTFDTLIEYHDFVKVCDEVHVGIDHVLANKTGDPTKIRQILSHPSALNQCARQLSTEFPEIPQIHVLSTAEAAQRATEDQECAAICASHTAAEYGLEIIKPNFADYPNNVTRFFVCALTDSPPSGNDRTLLAVRFGENRPGQLHKITGILAEEDIDLTFIQSRPYKVRPQQYVLIFEMIGHKSDPGLKKAFLQIEQVVRETEGWKKVLGSYPHRERKSPQP